MLEILTLEQEGLLISDRRKRSSVYLNKIQNLYFKIKFILVSIKTSKNYQIGVFFSKFRVLKMTTDHSISQNSVPYPNFN